MRLCWVLLIAACAPLCFAVNKNWQDAEFSQMEIRQDDGGTVVAPVGGMIAAIPVNRCTIIYTFKTDKLIVQAFNNCKHLNFTLHEHMKIFPETNKLKVLDDSGKEVGLTILVKKLRNP